MPGARPLALPLTSVVATAVLSVALGGLLAGCSGGKDSVDQGAGGDQRFVALKAGESFTAPAKRKSAPSVSGDSLTGQQISLSQYRGSVVVLNVWASWCAPCRAETPTLVKTARALPGVHFLGVNEKETSASAARAFVSDQGVPYPSVVDNVGAIAARFPGVGIPSTYVIDKSGRLAARFSGGISGDELLQVVDQVRGEAA